MEYSWHDFHRNNKMQKLNTQSDLNLTLLPWCVQVSETQKQLLPELLHLKLTHIPVTPSTSVIEGKAITGFALYLRYSGLLGSLFEAESLTS